MNRLLHIPDLSLVPSVSDVESACRHAGAIPQSDASRAHAHRYLLQRVERKYAGEAAYDDVDAVNADVAALTAYFQGEFERKQSDGRPFDGVRQDRVEDAIEQIQKIRQLEHCTRDEAIRRLLERRGHGSNRDLFAYLRNTMKR
jgi:hypothetical protein